MNAHIVGFISMLTINCRWGVSSSLQIGPLTKFPDEKYPAVASQLGVFIMAKSLMHISE